MQTALRQTVEGAFHEDTASAGLKRCLAAAAGVEDFAALKDRMDSAAAQVHALFEDLVGVPGRALIAQHKQEDGS